MMTEWLGDGHSVRKIKLGHSFTSPGVKTMKAHEHLFMADDQKKHIYQVLEGVVSVYKMLADGRRQIVNFYFAGDLIGLENSDNWMHYGEPLCDAEIRCIPTSTVHSLINDEPGFGQALLSTLATELAETREQLLSLGRKSAIEKVATFLVRIARRSQPEQSGVYRLHLPMTRTEIGDYLGLTIETVSRNITKLRTSGLIRLESKHRVSILDMDQLEELANGDAGGE